MSFRRQLVLRSAAMIVALMILGGAALWSMDQMKQDYSVAMTGYEDLRTLYEIGAEVVTARSLIYLERPDARDVLRRVQAAFGRLNEFQPRLNTGRMPGLRRALGSELVEAQDALNHMLTSRQGDVATLTQPLDRVLSLVRELSSEIRLAIDTRQQAAESHRRLVRNWAAALCGLLVLVAVGVSVSQYRTVMRPLRLLQRTTHELAQGQLHRRVPAGGPEEFAALARDFNAMADQLDTLYRDLERQVREKSRELVRSERLASVGFLAAGVAHEINNPVGIIAGHAELALREMGPAPDPLDLRGTLTVIAEEAFRCKEIVRRLLALARPSAKGPGDQRDQEDELRRPVPLADVARAVVETVGGLRGQRPGAIELAVPEGQAMLVLAAEGEMKQVLLNLVINGLEAVDSPEGRVKIDLSRRAGEVEISVSDNGRGMTPEVLEHIFEPFFTAKRGAGAPGTGLGLSITHAIVRSHGGRIQAFSAGAGRGSKFTVWLPEADVLDGVSPARPAGGARGEVAS